MPTVVTNPGLMPKLVRLDKPLLLELANTHFDFARLLVEAALKPVSQFGISLIELKRFIFEKYSYEFCYGQQQHDLYLQIAIQLLELNHRVPGTLMNTEAQSLFSTPIVAQFIITNTKRDELLIRYSDVELNTFFKVGNFSIMESTFVTELLIDRNLTQRLRGDSLIRMVTSSQAVFNFAVDNCLGWLPDDVKIALLPSKASYTRKEYIVSDQQKEKILNSLNIVNLVENSAANVYLENCTPDKCKELFTSRDIAVVSRLNKLETGTRLSYAMKANVLSAHIESLQEYQVIYYQTGEEISSFLKRNSRDLTDQEVRNLVDLVLRNEKPILISDLTLNNERCAIQLLSIPGWHQRISPKWGNAGNILTVLHNKYESVQALVAADETLKAILNSARPIITSASPAIVKAPAKPAAAQPVAPRKDDNCLLM